MAHLLAFRRGEACNIGDNRLGHMLGCPLGRILFGTTADFTDHHDSLGGIIVFKRLKRLLQRSADDRVAASTQTCGKTNVRQLSHQLIGERTGLRHQTQRSTGDDAVRNNAKIATIHTFRRRQGKQTRAVRTDNTHILAQCEFNKVRAIGNRNAFGDDNNQLDAGFNGFDHGILGETRRHEHDARLGAGDFHGFGAIAEHTQRNILAVFGRWEIDFLAGLAGVDAADDIGAGLQHAGGMGHALMSGHTLHDDRCAILNEKRHFSEPPCHWPQDARPAVRLLPWSVQHAD